MKGKPFAKVLAAVTALTLLGGVMGCQNGEPDDGYYEEIYTNPLADRDVGGADTLTLAEGKETLTLENENLRIVLNRTDGGIRELVNKQSKVYLTKDSGAIPLRINRIENNREVVSSAYRDFSYAIASDGEAQKAVDLQWVFDGNLTVKARVSVSKGADEVVFRLSLRNNDQARTVYNVEYPVIADIGTLYQKERDYLLSPFVTGYLFNNPLENFNETTFPGITKSYGLYPSGWEYPMQFQAYFSEGIGGFQFSTRDGGSTIKSFTFTGQGGRLRTSIYHYLDDIKSGDVEFDYDISIANLTQGTWYESAERYKAWASGQSWTQKGLLQNRTDIDRSFYEDVTLCNFNFPYTGSYGRENQKKLYEMTKQAAGGRILNVGFGNLFNTSYYSDKLLDLSKDNRDYFVFFEFPDFHDVKSANNNPAEWNTSIKAFTDAKVISDVLYNVNGTLYFHECPSCEDYMERFLAKEQAYYDQYGVNGYYHDVSVAAVHPKQCFSLSHPHGTKINAIPLYLEHIKRTREVAERNGVYNYGHELIFEQMLPYTDFYQCRANAESLGWMEGERVSALTENGSCKKVSLFDYIYGAYGARRLDGYLAADPLLGESYYYIAANTALSGGIPEYNYEFCQEYLALDEIDTDMLNFIGSLGNVKRTFGKEYLVYGSMVKPPQTGAGSNRYPFVQTRYIGATTKEGVAEFPKIVATAYEKDGKIGIFLCNATSSELELKFVLNALRDYGIYEADITQTEEDGSVKSLAKLSGGKAKIDLKLKARQIVMLEIAK